MAACGDCGECGELGSRRNKDDRRRASAWAAMAPIGVLPLGRLMRDSVTPNQPLMAGTWCEIDASLGWLTLADNPYLMSCMYQVPGTAVHHVHACTSQYEYYITYMLYRYAIVYLRVHCLSVIRVVYKQ